MSTGNVRALVRLQFASRAALLIYAGLLRLDFNGGGRWGSRLGAISWRGLQHRMLDSGATALSRQKVAPLPQYLLR
jgi:hypothetical protein